MCMGSRPKMPAPPPKPEFKDAPPAVTGEQEGVENPFDTQKITDQLKLRRKKKEKGIKIKKGDPEFSNVRIAGLKAPDSSMGSSKTSSPYSTKSLYS